MLAATAARHAAKLAALPLGVLGQRGPGDFVVLLYHRIGESGSEIEMPPLRFRRQLEHLSAAERVVALDAAVAGHGGVVLTFDDGYADFIRAAVPLLVEYRVPALLYLATGLVDGAVDHLGWGDLREAVATGLVEIGSHTHSHANLLTSDARTAQEEMRRSKELIEDELGRPCRHFAFPWSVASPAAEHLARTLFETAALRVWTTNRRGRIDPYRLGRVPVLASDGDVFFRAKTAGRLNGEAVFYRLLGRGPWRFR